mmetsp:Transcript_23761/g.67172  ORF Transcript_23761/g.67172 Transcript_23761/m.67172 type:complete len:209 (+) Transcript_23761:488-1114(+)
MSPVSATASTSALASAGAATLPASASFASRLRSSRSRRILTQAGSLSFASFCDCGGGVTARGLRRLGDMSLAPLAATAAVVAAAVVSAAASTGGALLSPSGGFGASFSGFLFLRFLTFFRRIRLTKRPMPLDGLVSSGVFSGLSSFLGASAGVSGVVVVVSVFVAAAVTAAPSAGVEDASAGVAASALSSLSSAFFDSASPFLTAPLL